MTLCQSCNNNPATVHVLGVEEFRGFKAAENKINLEHLCETCAGAKDVPFAMPATKQLQNIWELLSQKAQGAPTAPIKAPIKSCDSCGTDVQTFQRTGRLGCEECYEAFADELSDIFDRIHGATAHAGRSPGEDPATFERRARVKGLERDLEAAIEQEAYERAAGIRDELKGLEDSEEGATSAPEAS